MKTQSLYPESLFQAQESSTGMRRKIAVAIAILVILTVCGFALWEGIQTAVTRQTTDGKPEGGFVPEQRLSVAEAVRGYTLDAAYAGRREKGEGSIEPGKLADLIIVSRNIFEIEPRHIAETKVLTTIVGGRVVYQAPAQ